MTPEEKIQLDRLEQKLDTFLELYYRTNLIDKTVFNNPVIFNQQNDTSFGKSTDKLSIYNATPVVRASAISAPSGGGTAFTDAIDITGRTAINSIRTAIKNYGITL